ncbi:capsular polysaccharide synthesis protein [Mannheimia massilioguelmaensis]|uniref:capsular polysaccharide synthesis protein n=1 Tax=Mannheimia massilioguelmaensis TaxID=1604354 RepID=UPI0005CA7E31|nr:capsular polysaccharide synthesis protein [Mannheimia massilioguelmaensis]
MEIKESVFETIISKTENVTKTAGDLFNDQYARLIQLQVAVKDKQDALASELLDLASELNKNSLSAYATRIESYVVQHLLNAPYDAKRAFTTHKSLFAERHEMAIFLSENLEEIKKRVNKRLQEAKPTQSDKIKVFTYWDNDDKLPPIVSLCRESLKKYISTDKFDLIILNSESYKEWTDFRKEQIKAEITQAHFTDILRTKLLEKWGGFWIDATDMLTQDFYEATQKIREQKQFIFTYAGSRTGTWFMYSKPRNYIMSMLSEAISLWWELKCYLTNYFMIHDIIEMFYWVDPDYRCDWDEMLKIHPSDALSVLRAYNRTISPEEFDKLISSSFVHKLTYKYDAEKIVQSSALSYLLKRK